VPIKPDLDRVREIRTDLDERRPERLIHHIEVIRRDAAVGLSVTEARDITAALIRMVGGAGKHSLELLRHPDRRHPRAPLPFQPLQIGPHHLHLALPLGETHHRDVVLSGEVCDRFAEPQPD
jgi:hypothetical protein